MNLFKKWFAPFLLLFSVFSGQIFHCYLSIKGLVSESGMLQYVFIAIFVGAIVLLVRDKRVKGYDNSKILFPMLLILVLYFLSSAFYGTPPPRYYSSILRYGSACVGSAIIGMYIAKHPCFNEIDTLLPYFVLPFGFIIGTVGLQAARMGEILKDDSGLNYHTVSYYMSEMYAYSTYYVFFSSVQTTLSAKLLKWLMIGMMFFCVTVCLLSGGRGAFVFIIAVTFLLIYMLCKTGRMTILQVSSLIFVGLVVFSIFAVKFDIFNSVGFNRVANHLMDDDIRDSLREKALDIFLTSPVFGHGIGSIWLTLGFYSHNMFVDLLVEGGVILLFIVCRVLFIMGKRLLFLARTDYSYVFFILVMSKSVVSTMFSGYWIGTYQLWMIFGFIMIRPKMSLVNK